VIEKVVRIREFGEHDEVRENPAYWLSRPPGERIAEVERLRRMYYGDLGRLQRVVRIVEREPR
jgi:hypothetical protein